MLKKMFCCILCGKIFKSEDISIIYMSGCGEDVDFVHACYKCIDNVNSGNVNLPEYDTEEVTETKEEVDKKFNKLIKDIDIDKKNKK